MLRMTLTMMRMRRSPRWSQGWWHWHVTSCDIGGHRDIEDDDNDDMVRSQVSGHEDSWRVTMHGGKCSWWLSELISAQSLPGLPTISQVTKWPSVVTSRLPKKTDDWERIYQLFGNIFHFDCLPDLVWNHEKGLRRGCENSSSIYFSLLINLERVRGNLIKCNYNDGRN